MKHISTPELVALMQEAVEHSATFPVWPQGEAPGAIASPTVFQLEENHTGPSAFDRSVTGVRAPQITVYAPEKPNGVGILVTPGGSYRRVVLDKEGSALAPFFNDRGYTLFVMTYRLPGDGHTEGANAPLADVQRAMRTLRARAQEWQLDPDRRGLVVPMAVTAWKSTCKPRWFICRHNGTFPVAFRRPDKAVRRRIRESPRWRFACQGLLRVTQLHRTNLAGGTIAYPRLTPSLQSSSSSAPAKLRQVIPAHRGYQNRAHLARKCASQPGRRDGATR